MAFKKGQSGNPNGRPRGAKNKATAELADKVMEIVERNIATIQQDIEQLEPKDRIKVLTALLNYVIPKQQSIAPVIGKEPLPNLVVEIIGKDGKLGTID